MDVYVYKSARKQGYYLYLAEKEAFDVLPESLRKALGPLELALRFDLHPDRKLARSDPAAVLENMKKQGFHLQIDDPLITPEKYTLR